MLWIPFWAAGVINGVGHYFGYRNFETQDASRNIIPLGILIGGEEFHNNHHAYSYSAKLANKWWELDMGWVYIRLLEICGLASVKRVSPRTAFTPGKSTIDSETRARDRREPLPRDQALRPARDRARAARQFAKASSASRASSSRAFASS